MIALKQKSRSRHIVELSCLPCEPATAQLCSSGKDAKLPAQMNRFSVPATSWPPESSITHRRALSPGLPTWADVSCIVTASAARELIAISHAAPTARSRAVIRARLIVARYPRRYSARKAPASAARASAVESGEYAPLVPAHERATRAGHARRRNPAARRRARRCSRTRLAGGDGASRRVARRLHPHRHRQSAWRYARRRRLPRPPARRGGRGDGTHRRRPEQADPHRTAEGPRRRAEQADRA